MVAATDLKAGDRVMVRTDVDAPAWATSGVVVKPHDKAYNSGDWHLHPSVRWEDGVTRPVPDSWLSRLDDLESAAADVVTALARWTTELRRAAQAQGRR